MRSQILLGLSQLGWQLTNQGQFSLAVHPNYKFGLIFSDLADCLEPPLLFLKQEFPRIKTWNIIVLSPQGLDSAHLKNMSGSARLQYWFWDTQSGNLFPSPPNRDRRLIEWLAKLAHGQIIPLEESYQTNHFNPMVNNVIIGLNVLMFVLMTLAGGSENEQVLIAFGAKVNELIQAGQVWRLLSSAFLHIGIFHLIFNLYALYSLGSLAEKLMGHSRYLFLYLLSGVGGSLASYFFSPAISAGASGAIFGLLGALVVYCLKFPRLWNSGLGTNLIMVIVINLVFGLSQPGIDNYAHLGGLFTGALTALTLLQLIKQD